MIQPAHPYETTKPSYFSTYYNTARTWAWNNEAYRLFCIKHHTAWILLREKGVHHPFFLQPTETPLGNMLTNGQRCLLRLYRTLLWIRVSDKNRISIFDTSSMNIVDTADRYRWFPSRYSTIRINTDIDIIYRQCGCIFFLSGAMLLWG